MRILVIASTDADNWHIYNIVKELIRRKHAVDIYETQSNAHIFKDLQVPVHPFNKLNSTKLKEYNMALCSDSGATHLLCQNIYVVSAELSFCVNMTSAADFILKYRAGKDDRYYQNTAWLPIGTPKYDKINKINEADEKKQILYIDSGHRPFGYEGKKQIADMILQICIENPDYELVIRPRFLRNSNLMTHRNTMHIYDIIESLCNGEIPANLTMLEEHQDLSTQISNSHSVITLQSGTVFDVLLHDKGLCIAEGYAYEDKFDMRSLKNQLAETEFYAKTGCSVPISDIPKYMPHGIKSDCRFLNEVLPHPTGASAKAVDVMEFLWSNFVRKGKYPQICEYSYNEYESEMTESGMTFAELRHLRFKNQAYKHLAIEQDFISVPLDLSEAYQFVKDNYVNYTFSLQSYNEFINEVKLIKYKAIRENREIMMRDPINQDFLLEAMYHLGYDDEILDMPQEEILAVGPWHYYAARVFQDRGAVLEEKAIAIPHYIEFLKEANSRSFEKYRTEISGGGYRVAYNELFKLYDGINAPARDIAALLFALHDSKRQHLPDNRLIGGAWNNLFYKASADMSVYDSEFALAIKAGELITRRRDAEIKRLNREVTKFKEESGRFTQELARIVQESARLREELGRLKQRRRPVLFVALHKIKRGLLCARDHGWRYTIKYGFKKISDRLALTVNTTVTITRTYRNQLYR